MSEHAPEPVLSADDDIQKKVIRIIAEQLVVEEAEVTLDARLVTDLNADSLDSVELTMEFEDEFEISIPDEEAEKLQTVGQVVDYIREHKSKSSST